MSEYVNDARGYGVSHSRSPSDKISDLSIVVLGGFVMDAVVPVPELPNWGEAVQAENFELVPGGKGLNQAFAARKLGAHVHGIGAVGDDAFGSEILDSLSNWSIGTSGIEVVQGSQTPVTIVFSKKNGESSFVGWKNKRGVRVDAALVRRHRELIQNADVLLMTLEVPPEAVSAAVKIANPYRVLKLLNPAPPLDYPHRFSDLPLRNIDLLVPNEWEARELAGAKGKSERYSVREVTEYLGNDTDGAMCVCVTRAHSGCAVYNDHRYREYDAYEVDASDTTGASDAFCAVLGIYRRAGYEMEAAIDMAQAAGAFVVERKGTSLVMPDRESLERKRLFLARQREALRDS